MSQKNIPNRELLLSLLDYDPFTGIVKWKYRSNYGKGWNTKFNGKQAGTLTSKGYLVISINGLDYQLHRIIWTMVYSDPIGFQIDHKNEIKNDNRLCNLRLATGNQNQHNVTMYKNNKTGFKGVSLYKNGSYIARIGNNGIQKTIGYFRTPELAYDAYCKFAIELHKDFAKI